MSISRSSSTRPSYTVEEALDYHQYPTPGKIATQITVPTRNARDLSLAYSPGVAEPCRAIAKDANKSFLYTNRSNLVGVVSNGTAVLGLGNIGARASKPVMEGKALLFKRYAGVDCFDIEVDTEDPKEFINTVKNISRTFGAINLEDIKAPECFEIETELKKQCDIPIFHDDQHGTAVAVSAALLNVLDLVKKDMKSIKIVCMGAGAAGIAVLKLLVNLGADKKRIYLLDSRGVIHTKRFDYDRLVPSKKEFASDDPNVKTLEDAMKNADVFIGLSGPNLLPPETLVHMNENPALFVCSNPDPEIDVDLALEKRPDAIIATGRSDYPNQINNVLGFPYIFRAALDVRATDITDNMIIAAAKALAKLAKSEVPPEVLEAYDIEELCYGRDYILPKPVDPRLLGVVSDAVAKAAIEDKVAKLPYPSNYPLQSLDDIFKPSREDYAKKHPGKLLSKL